MSRFVIAGRSTAVPTAARGPNVYGVTTVRPIIREIGIFNASTTQWTVGICRASAVGTKGVAITPVCLTDDSHVAQAVGANTHTVDATVGLPVRQAMVGASYASGVVFTFGDIGLFVNNLTTAGIVITAPLGGGQLFDFYIEWDE